MTAPPTASSTTKIIDILRQKKKDDAGNKKKKKPYISLEYFPPRTEEGVKNLKLRMDRMKAAVHPIFSDITWGAGGSTSELSMDLAVYMAQTGHTANLHMTCTNMSSDSKNNPVDDIRHALQQAQARGVVNIVALRGDPPAGVTEWKAADGGFTCALDLVQFIRQQFGSESFGISVAGYPEGHPNAITEIADVSKLTASELARCSQSNGKTFACLDADYAKELEYLKKKVDAGADFIITQMFFDVPVYKQFVKDCRAIGIDCPILPGLMCINAYAGFCKMTGFCKTRVPADLQKALDDIKDDSAAVKQFGIDFGTRQCQQIMEEEEESSSDGYDAPPALHFYTLNLEKVVYGILEKLGLLDSKAAAIANESDAATQVATGSAWARVGDKVSSVYGVGTVTHMDAATAAATVRIDNWVMAEGQKPTAYLQKGQYKKVF